jgi:hypothetical protein
MTDAPNKPGLKIPELHERLFVKGHAESPRHAWLEASWGEPERFWRELFAAHDAAHLEPTNSKALEHYDFYHDAVLRHAGEGRAALRWPDANLSWQELSYRDLQLASNARAHAWKAQEVERGEVVCIVCPMGPELLVNLVTALRLGLVISYLPPQGRAYLSRRLDALGPDRIACDPSYTPMLSGFEDAILAPVTTGGVDIEEASYSYAGDEELGMFFSPLADNPAEPAPLDASRAYLHAVRDGKLVLGLRPGDSIAYPGLHPVQEQLCLLLATLLSGATWVQLGMRDLELQPTLLTSARLRALGVSRALRGHLEQTGGDLSGACDAWFRSPAEAADVLKWQDLADRTGLANVPGANLLLDSSAGGAVLFSPRRTVFITLGCFPAAGEPWVLQAPYGRGMTTPGPVGYLTPAEAAEDDAPRGGVMLMHARNEWFYVTTRETRRRGHTYPRDEVLACLQDIPGVAHVSLGLAPTSNPGDPLRYMVLVFMGPAGRTLLAGGTEEYDREIEQRIQMQIGAEYLPDGIEYFPLYAREVEGEVDHDWCHAQFISGTLHRKSKQQTFELISSLRRAAVRGEAPATPRHAPQSGAAATSRTSEIGDA